MQKIYLDSNILIASQIQNHPLHKQTTEVLVKLDKIKTKYYYLSPLCFDEYLYILQKYIRNKLIDKFNQKFLRTDRIHPPTIIAH